MSFLYDTHVHTSEASLCGSSTAREQVQAYKKRGYTGIIITDHYVRGYSCCDETLPWKDQVRFFMSAYESAKDEGGKCGLDVFFGWEYSPGEGGCGLDFLTYGLGEEFMLANPHIFDMTVVEYCKFIRKSGGYVAQAHPYRDVASKGPEWGPADPNVLDGVEVYNAGKKPEVNKAAYDFAKKHGLAMQAGSDSHMANENGGKCGISLTSRAKNIFDIIDAIKSNKVDLIMPNFPPA